MWVHGAQSYRPFGTAAEYTVVLDALAVDLPDEVPDELGACLGIPGITAHVHGVLGGVGGLAAALATAARDGALAVPIGHPLPLARAAGAHDQVDAGTRERALLTTED